MDAFLALIAVVLVLLMLVLIVWSTIFWVIMLIDVAERTDWRDEQEKIMWLALLLILGWIAAIAYYFAVRKSRGKAVPAPLKKPKA